MSKRELTEEEKKLTEKGIQLNEKELKWLEVQKLELELAINHTLTAYYERNMMLNKIKLKRAIKEIAFTKEKLEILEKQYKDGVDSDKEPLASIDKIEEKLE